MAAASEMVTGLVAKLVTLPQNMMRGLAQAAVATGDERLMAKLRRPPTAADNMNPKNPRLQALASIPVANIPAHSIMWTVTVRRKKEMMAWWLTKALTLTNRTQKKWFAGIILAKVNPKLSKRFAGFYWNI